MTLLTGSGWQAGAVGGALGEALPQVLDQAFEKDANGQIKHAGLFSAATQLLSAAVASQSGLNGMASALASQNAVENNYLKHQQTGQLLSELQACKAAKCNKDQYNQILKRYETAAASNSRALAECTDRSCVESHLREINRSVAQYQQLISEVDGKLGRDYDLTGLIQGNPEQIAKKSENPFNNWGNRFSLDKDLAEAMLIQNGWLSEQEKQNLTGWEARTQWLDQAAGKPLSIQERASVLVMLGSELGPGAKDLGVEVTKALGKAIGQVKAQMGTSGSSQIGPSQPAPVRIQVESGPYTRNAGSEPVVVKSPAPYETVPVTVKQPVAGLGLTVAERDAILAAGKGPRVGTRGVVPSGAGSSGSFSIGETPPLLTLSRQPGTVTRNALSDTEFAQAQELATFRGGKFVGAPTENFAGIDGWLNGVPTQLKIVTGNGEQAILRNIVKGARNISSQGYVGDIAVDATRTGVNIDSFVKFVAPNTPVGRILNEGSVNNVYIKFGDGWLNITKGTLVVPGG
ncbi:hypothetical protein HNQ59_003931 [Chitinivorax tropicus]|uniref:Uncharacterized protein n=1 Tax=Chitinivorax tropicus TaxID=714531 RepID=A0A840MWA7_9PROT|nr:hypothetical protein [Chitinivorax tropicus]MBB5020606.1 hypothetical protein [Chitinivorax tropicus]